MGLKLGFAAALCAASMVVAMPAAQAATGGTGAAELVRKLDIMLMVSSLRCRFTADSFQTDYADFSSSHLSELNDANSTLMADLARGVGSADGQRALDRLSTSMANQYGQGHPWLDCSELKRVTRELADERQPGALLLAAEELLDDHIAYGRVSLDADY